MPESTQTKSANRSGSCLCGGVSYTLTGPLRDVVACHCSQCRKTSGHYFAATRVGVDQLHITDLGTLTWFASSQEAKRGFCNRCGGNLFWQRNNSDHVSVTAGTLDLPTRLTLTHHIYKDDASDYVSFHPDDVTFARND